jgi:hypothetical protein
LFETGRESIGPRIEWLTAAVVSGQIVAEFDADATMTYVCITNGDKNDVR